MISNLPELTVEHMSDCIDLALGGVIGYYGRSTVIRWSDAEAIEKMRRQALRARGYLGYDNGFVYSRHGAGHKCLAPDESQ